MTQATLLVNLFAGPGCGKSTTASQAFALLKQEGVNVELSHEYAKDLTWEGAMGKLGFQPYVAGKQLWRDKRLDGKVDVIVTDTSILYSVLYRDPKLPGGEHFDAFLVNYFRSLWTLNIFLERDPERRYNPMGRAQTEAEAITKDQEIKGLLHEFEIPYLTVPMVAGHDSAARIVVGEVMEELDG